MLLLLPFTTVKASVGIMPSASSIQKAADQKQSRLKNDSYSVGLLAESNPSVHFQSVSRPESSAATLFTQNPTVLICAGTYQLAGRPRSRLIIPVERQLLFPFHVFW
jgi:hypothetical protein